MSGILTSFIAVFLAVFPIVDPLAGGLIFFGMTSLAAPETRARLARLVAIYSFIVLNTSLFIGGYVLNFFGISVPVLRVAGGLVVAAAGWKMLNAREDYGEAPKKAGSVVVLEEDFFRKAFYPITMPLTTGPGTISVLIALGTGRPEGRTVEAMDFVIGAVLATTALAATIYVCYAGSGMIRRVFGGNGTEIAIRLTAFILFCIGVQILWTGAEDLIRSVLVPR
jgi:multiple antibiotic resistance protein